MKSLQTLILFGLVFLFMAVASSCQKNNDDTTTATGKTIYLPPDNSDIIYSVNSIEYYYINEIRGWSNSSGERFIAVDTLKEEAYRWIDSVHMQTGQLRNFSEFGEFQVIYTSNEGDDYEITYEVQNTDLCDLRISEYFDSNCQPFCTNSLLRTIHQDCQ